LRVQVVFVKKINKFVKPKDGFNVIATANTKGQGSEDGKFIGTNVLNEAFLERFPITFEQSYPTMKIEKKILTNTLKAAGKTDDQFVDKLTTWADVIRKTYLMVVLMRLSQLEDWYISHKRLVSLIIR